MIQATFLDHSGFLVELPAATLLFDWWKGELPPHRPNVPLLVFVSHRHEDHFNPEVFSLPAAQFILSSDISTRRLSRLGIPDAQIESCVFLPGDERFTFSPDITVETLRSTDEGVAFLVTVGKTVIFHAGDLNWWHWEGEPDPWNPDMERQFRLYSEPLRNRAIDLAFLPLDPRQEQYGFLGARHFLNLAKISRFIPMHQWNNFAFTEQFLSCYPEFKEQAYPVTATGQRFIFEGGSSSL